MSMRRFRYGIHLSWREDPLHYFDKVLWHLDYTLEWLEISRWLSWRSSTLVFFVHHSWAKRFFSTHVDFHHLDMGRKKKNCKSWDKIVVIPLSDDFRISWWLQQLKKIQPWFCQRNSFSTKRGNRFCDDDKKKPNEEKSLTWWFLSLDVILFEAEDLSYFAASFKFLFFFKHKSNKAESFWQKKRPIKMPKMIQSSIFSIL